MIHESLRDGTANRANPGVSPAAMMQRIYESTTAGLRDAAARYASELEAARNSEREERAKRMEAETQLAELQALQRASHREPPAGQLSTTSNVATLLKVEEAIRGRNDRAAILLT